MDPEDVFDKKASALYLWYLNYIEYIDDEEIQRKEID
jgi:hypothetical protein